MRSEGMNARCADSSEEALTIALSTHPEPRQLSHYCFSASDFSRRLTVM
jgi:hypothetical protein